MGNSAGWLRPRGVRRAARCPGPVSPQPMRGGGGRNGAAGTPTTSPDAMPVATHTLPLSDPPAGNRDQRGTTQSTGTGSHRRPAQRADCAMGSMSPPHSLHHKELGPTETGGGRQVSGHRVWATGRGVRADRFQNADPAPCRAHDAVAPPLRTSAERSRRPATTPAYTHRGRPSGPVARESVPTRFNAMPGAHLGHPVSRGSRGTVHTSRPPPRPFLGRPCGATRTSRERCGKSSWRT